jgi:hypothetical protein
MEMVKQVEFGFAVEMFNLSGDEDKRRARRTERAEALFLESERERKERERERSVVELVPLLF